jgi:hypothetical protein
MALPWRIAAARPSPDQRARIEPEKPTRRTVTTASLIALAM